MTDDDAKLAAETFAWLVLLVFMGAVFFLLFAGVEAFLS